MSALMRMMPNETVSHRNYARLSAFIETTTGIRMSGNKKGIFEARLQKRVRALGLADVDDYCARLFDQGLLQDESLHLIDALTTNKTDFFREIAHFNFMSEHLLPEWTMDGIGVHRPLKVWSAAASIGAEAYTLAMIIENFGRTQKRYRYSILGTDISTRALAEARAAIYDEDMIEPVPFEMRQRYLLRSKAADARKVRIVPELRKAVSFGRLNLMDPVYPVDEDFDVIFCRNVLIYFDKQRQAQVLNNLCRHLRPGGHLFIGHSETVIGCDLPVRPVRNSVFKKI